MPKIKYHYALNENGDIVDIADVVKEDRKNQRFFCINCGAEMVPKLGEVRTRHFAHKTETLGCNSETYLHKLAKLLLKEKFYSSKPFEIAYWQVVKCSHKSSCPFFKEEECKEKQLKFFNLKKYYDTCQEEQRADNFIADLKISSSHNADLAPVIIEIYVSHKCTLPKKGSGLKIIEVRIKDESDIMKLISSPIAEDEECRFSFKARNERCRFYGFSREAKFSEPLDVRSIRRFYLFPTGSAFVSNMDERRSCQNCSKKDNPKAILELNIDDFYLGDPSLYEIGYVTAQNLSYDVKTCELCKYRKADFDYPNLCCLYKKYGTPRNPKSSEAMVCPYYLENKERVNGIQLCLSKIAVTVAK